MVTCPFINYGKSNSPHFRLNIRIIAPAARRDCLREGAAMQECQQVSSATELYEKLLSTHQTSTYPTAPLSFSPSHGFP